MAKSDTVIKIVSLVAMGLGIAGNVISGWASNQAMKSTVAKEVADALAESVKES